MAFEDRIPHYVHLATHATLSGWLPDHALPPHTPPAISCDAQHPIDEPLGYGEPELDEDALTLDTVLEWID